MFTFEDDDSSRRTYPEQITQNEKTGMVTLGISELVLICLVTAPVMLLVVISICLNLFNKK